MKDMITRCLWVLMGSLVLDAIAAFSLVVSVLSAVEVAMMLIGLVLMFWVGVQVGATNRDEEEERLKRRQSLRRLGRAGLRRSTVTQHQQPNSIARDSLQRC